MLAFVQIIFVQRFEFWHPARFCCTRVSIFGDMDIVVGGPMEQKGHGANVQRTYGSRGQIGKGPKCQWGKRLTDEWSKGPTGPGIIGPIIGPREYVNGPLVLVFIFI